MPIRTSSRRSRRWPDAPSKSQHWSDRELRRSANQLDTRRLARLLQSIVDSGQRQPTAGGKSEVGSIEGTQLQVAGDVDQITECLVKLDSLDSTGSDTSSSRMRPK